MFSNYIRCQYGRYHQTGATETKNPVGTPHDHHGRVGPGRPAPAQGHTLPAEQTPPSTQGGNALQASHQQGQQGHSVQPLAVLSAPNNLLVANTESPTARAWPWPKHCKASPPRKPQVFQVLQVPRLPL